MSKETTQHTHLSSSEKLTVISNFSTMLTAGIPILESIDSLLEDSKGNIKKLLDSLRADIVQGKHVYNAFSRFPDIFDKVTVSVIKASEESGTLDVALKDLKDSIRKEMEFADKIKSALTYPMLIVIVFFGVLTAILVFVIPKISTVFLRLRVTIPLPTRILMFVSDAILKDTIPILVGLVLLATGLIFLYKKQRRLFLTTLFSLPLLSRMAKEIDLTRFTHSLYLLLTSGIPITVALELTEDVVLKTEVKRAIMHARETVLAGKKLSDGFRRAKTVFPSIMIKIAEAGEKSGTLDKSMQDVSDQLDYQVTQTLKTVTTLIEPIMLVVVGILVGGMMLAIIAPIYGLIGQVGAH